MKTISSTWLNFLSPPQQLHHTRLGSGVPLQLISANPGLTLVLRNRTRRRRAASDMVVLLPKILGGAPGAHIRGWQEWLSTLPILFNLGDGCSAHVMKWVLCGHSYGQKGKRKKQSLKLSLSDFCGFSRPSLTQNQQKQYQKHSTYFLISQFLPLNSFFP